MAHEGREDWILPVPETQKGGWKPSRGFRIGMSGVAFFVGILTVASIIAATTNPEPSVVAVTPTPSPQPTTIAPHRQGPGDEFAGEPGEASIGAGPSAVQATPAPTATGLSSAALAVTATPTVGQDWTATPAPAASSANLAPAAAALLANVEAHYGVLIAAHRQDWGDDEAEQLRNLGAVQATLQALPTSLLSKITVGQSSPLTFLSNEHGQTVSGWQPYGDRAANYYTNEDHGPAGSQPSNQVVLQPGSSAQTIAHELVHAYQLRDTAPGAFVAAMLTPEMKSFMQATGWKQLATDEQVLAVQTGSWDAINALFSYEGRPLSYVNEYGSVATLYGPNPLEAFAEAAGLYYAHSTAITLPNWADYWAWFDANLN